MCKIYDTCFYICKTLIEGRRLTEYIKNISDKLLITENELITQMQDQAYLKTLIEKYWFLDESIIKMDYKLVQQAIFLPYSHYFHLYYMDLPFLNPLKIILSFRGVFIPRYL